MRSINNTFIRISALVLALTFALPAAFATTMDSTLTIGMISVKTTRLNPLEAEERDFQSITALMYEGLYCIDDDYRPQLCLAESCEISDNGKDWYITLRSDVTFFDGAPLTAYDVVATINEILQLAEEGKGQYNQLKYVVTSATANDARSLRIKVSRTYYGTYYALTFPILPRDQVQADIPAGTGPFIPTAFKPGSYLYLSANPDYWDGTPFVQEINVLFQSTYRALIEDYEYNRLDAAITNSASAGQYRTGLTNLNIIYRTRQLETLLINNKAFPLNDINVRKAIRYAIDLDAICTAVYSGMAKRTDTPLPYGTWMYQDNDTAYEYNPEKAKRLLAEAGWSNMDDDDVLDKIVDGKNNRLHLRLWVYEEQNNSVRVKVANMIKTMLAEVGIEVEVRTLSFALTKERLEARNFDLCIAAFQMDTIPDPGFLLISGNTASYCGYKSATMDKLFKALREDSADAGKFEAMLHQMQDIFAEDCPFICMWYRASALLTRKVFTTAKDIREPEVLRGIEKIGK